MQTAVVEVLDKPLGSMIVSQARSWLDTKYHHQGRLKKTSNYSGGVDCIGLVMGVSRELGLKAKSGRLFTNYDRYDYSEQPDGYELKENLRLHFDIVELGKIVPGDILLFRFLKHPQHVGIVSDFLEGTLGVIHCYRTSGYVVEHHLTQGWKSMLVEAYRFPEQSAKTSKIIL